MTPWAIVSNKLRCSADGSYLGVGERYNRYGMTLLLQIDDESVCSVPPWTDVVAPDPEILLGEQRALFRVVDLLELARLVDRLNRRELPGR